MNKALILIDIQNDYFDGGTNPLIGSVEASLNSRKILDWFRSRNELVIHVQHLAVRPGATFFIPGTFGAEIHHLVVPIKSEKVIQKHSPNSFLGTDLKDYLDQNQVNQLVICGMMTHMCVDATTRAAKDLGYQCLVISDGCATRDLEIQGKTIPAQSVHNSFLAAFASYYAGLTTTEEFLQE